MWSLLLCLALASTFAVAGSYLLVWRKEYRRREYLRKREARTRQQWADMMEMGSERLR